MKQIQKRFGNRAAALLLAVLLCFAVSIEAFAEEGETFSSPVENETLSSIPEEEVPIQEEPVLMPSETPVPSEAPVENEGEQEEAGLKENEETQITAGSDVELPFTDVPSNRWYYSAVAYAYENKLFSGTSETTFSPNAPMTRGMFVTVLANATENYKKADWVGRMTFTDVDMDLYYAPPIEWAYQMGLINGVGDSKFSPDAPVTREQMAKIFYDYAAKTGNKVTYSNSTFHTFPDKGRVSNYARTGMKWATDHKIINGSAEGGTSYLRPQSTATRAEVAQVFKSAQSVLVKHTVDKNASIPSKDPNDVDPVEPSPTPSSGFAVGQSVQVSASGGLNLRAQKTTDSKVIDVLATGTILTVTDVSGLPWLGVKTANGTAGFVHSGSSDDPYVVVYTPGAASGVKLSASSLSLRQYQTARLDASVTSGMNAMSWTSSDPSVAVVGYTVSYGSREHGAMVYGKKPGTATLTFSDAGGQNKVSCTVTVVAPESVRFAYASENSAVKGKNFDLVAITDPNRGSVTFTITAGPAKGTYSTSSYTTESRNSEYGLPTNTVRVFKKSVAFQAAGTYTVRAMASGASDYQEFEVFVRSTEESVTASISGERRASTQGLCLVANFEGCVEEIEDDVIASGNPTVGYGYVVPKNTAFYNNLTKAEAFAMLVDKANNGGYTAGVNRFLKNNGVKMSQAQFDALLSFVWNCGTATLDPSEYDTPKVMLNAVVPPSDLSEGRPYTGTLNVGASAVYKDASFSSAVLVKVGSGQSVSVIGHTLVSGKKQAWYKVKYGSYTGWMPAGKVTFSATGLTRDLAYADAGTLSNNFLQWHKSGSTCIYGLLTRRLAECKVFFFGNYKDAFHNYVDLGEGNRYSPSPNYEKNTYGFVYPDCCKRYE